MASGDAPQTSSNTNYTSPGGPISGGTTSYNGATIGMQNPGMMDPSQLNPYAGKYIQNNADLYKQFSNSAAGGAFNPQFYDQMKQTQENQVTSSMGNQYAAMGLSGSSAELGGMNQAVQSNQMNWLNRQQGDQMKALQGLEGLNQQGYNQTMGVQNQYGNFQEAYNQSILGMMGMQQQQQMANNQNTAGMIDAGIGAAGMVGGMMLAGPAGGMAGGAMAKGMSGSMSTPGMSGAGSSSPWGGNPVNYGGDNYGGSYA